MIISGFDIDLKKVADVINSKGYNRVLLQIPEGLKGYYSKFVEFFEKNTSAEVIISGDPCFGACDIGHYELKDLGIDFIVQIGHVPIPSIKDFFLPMIFINAKANLDVKKVIEKAIPSLDGKKIGLVTTAQHVDLLDEAKSILEENGFEVLIGKGSQRISFAGQILGCNFSSATSMKDKVDLFLFIGDGDFHPLGLMLSTKKPVIACDPYTSKVRYKELDHLRDTILRQRYGAIIKAKDAKVFGILVGTKKGQQRIELAIKTKRKIEKEGKKAYIIAMNLFIPLNVESFRDVDCFVSTACPRIAIDDYMQYKKPIITPVELDIALGLKKWEDYKMDEIVD